MGFLELAKKRYSCRNYREAGVDRERIGRCIEAARLAPSACNSQPWWFVVVDDCELREELAKEAFEGILDFNHFAYKAGVLVLMVSERQKMLSRIAGIVKRKSFSLIDTGIAAEHFCLQAAEEGLGSCMLGWFNEGRVKKLLSIPRGKRVELIITLGESGDDDVGAKVRKGIDEISSYNKYR